MAKPTCRGCGENRTLHLFAWTRIDPCSAQNSPGSRIASERTDAHRARPFFLVRLVERRIEQPFVFDSHREVPRHMPGAARTLQPGSRQPPRIVPQSFRSSGKTAAPMRKGRESYPKCGNTWCSANDVSTHVLRDPVEFGGHSIRNGDQLLEFIRVWRVRFESHCRPRCSQPAMAATSTASAGVTAPSARTNKSASVISRPPRSRERAASPLDS